MSNAIKRQMKKASKKGMSPLEIAQMREIAQKAAHEAEQEAERIAVEKAFLYMLTIPLNVLYNDYWEKTCKKKAPEFLNKVMSLFESVEAGVVSYDDMNDFLEEMVGIRLTSDWLNERRKNEKV